MGRTVVGKFSPAKCNVMLISRKREITAEPLLLWDQQLPVVSTHKHLGLTISKDLTWNVHINSIVTKSLTRVNLLKRLKYILDRKTLDILYKSFIRPLLEYGSIVWDGCGEQNKLKLEHIQYEAGRVVCGAIKGTVRDHVYGELGWELLSSASLQT